MTSDQVTTSQLTSWQLPPVPAFLRWCFHGSIQGNMRKSSIDSHGLTGMHYVYGLSKIVWTGLVGLKIEFPDITHSISTATRVTQGMA